MLTPPAVWKTSPTLLGAWRSELERIDYCPWVGPRPYRDLEHPYALIGRDDEAWEIAQCVRDHAVTVLTGASGVGKTSALYAAVRPQLESWGYEVMQCTNWNPPQDFDAGTLIATQAAHDLPPEVRLGDGEPSFIEQLDRYYPDKAVIILDQFEELIRYRPLAYRKVLQWIQDTAESSRVRIVVSLRIEYEHELMGPGGLNIRPFAMTRYELAAITDPGVIEEIIGSGEMPSGEPAASSSAVETLVEVWSNTVDKSGWSEVGLLHLQATLFTLWHAANAARRQSDWRRVENADVCDLIGRSSEADTTRVYSKKVKPFEFSLAKSVEVKLDHCRVACAQSAVDSSLATRAREFVAAMSGHLSSGGYKISLNRDELAERVINTVAPPGVELAKAMLASKVDYAAEVRHPQDIPSELDWLAVRRSELLGGGGSLSSTWPWELDPEDLSGGPVLGLRPIDSYLEELRSFHFALEWLRTCVLVRVTSTEPGKVMVSLNHDRFGEGLARWKHDVATGSEEAIARVSAVRGTTLDWSAENTPTPEVIANVRWVDCMITRAFKTTTFVNCDFRGSTFRECRFEGVSFVNCVLDDVEFVDCWIIGRPRALPEGLTKEQKEKRPAFLVPAPAVVPILNRYRESIEAGSSIELFSETAGVAAVPAPKSSKNARLVPFEPQSGGVTMFGGRLSSLKMRACEFPDNGLLSLRHVAGTSVELAEQTQARVEVFAAALRGLTITLPIAKLSTSQTVNEGSDSMGENDQDKRGEDSNNAEFPFTLWLRDSRIINVWIGPDIRGTAEFFDCRIWQLFNGSDYFMVTLPESPVMGAVNVDASQDLIPFPPRLFPGAQDNLEGIRGEVVKASLDIDYRSQPAKYELTGDLDED